MKSFCVRNEALKAIVAQLTFVLLLTPIMGVVGGMLIGGSFLLGGLIAPLANAYFYFRVFSHFGARAARDILKAFYRGEAVKIMMTAIGFGVAFKIAWVSPLWLFIGYIVAQIGFLASPLLLKNRNIQILGIHAR